MSFGEFMMFVKAEQVKKDKQKSKAKKIKESDNKKTANK